MFLLINFLMKFQRFSLSTMDRDSSIHDIYKFYLHTTRVVESEDFLGFRLRLKQF